MLISLRLWVFLGIIGMMPAVVSAQADRPERSSQTPFRFQEIDEKSLGLWEGAQPVLVYNHGVISNSNASGGRPRSTYLHPIYGLDGEVITGDFPPDHVNHRGVHWVWPHIKIGDSEFDLWSLRGIRQEFRRWLARETTPEVAVLEIENAWSVGEREVVREQVWIRVHPVSEGSRSIDIALTWTPMDQPVTLWGAEGKSYGGFTFRYGPRTNTTITTPDGRTSNDLLMARLPWADLSGAFPGNAGRVTGATIFVHPAHPDYPPTWMTRHYGMLAVGWPGVTPKTFPAGKPFSCKYRIWIHRGAPDAQTIDTKYRSYLKEAL